LTIWSSPNSLDYWKKVPIYRAKAILSELIREAEAGEEVIITRDNAPVVILRPIVTKQTGRKFGTMKGRARADESFFESLSEEELRLWEGRK